MAETAEGFGDETTGLMSDNDNGRYDNRNEADSDENREDRRSGATDETDSARAVRSRASRRRRSGEEDDDDDEALTLKYGAKQLLLLVVPVSLCMLVVVATVISVKSYTNEDATLIYIPYKEDSSSSSSTKLGHALINTLVFLGIVVILTVVLVLLYKYRCYKALYGWLIAATGALVFLFSGIYLIELLQKYNLAMDWITYSLIVWNFGVVGMVVIHWKGPLRLLQIYHIIISALIALIFIKYLPDWTTWLVLGAFVIYDLCAVCCPKGPLRVLVETAKERNEDIFQSLIYSSMIYVITMAENENQTRGQRRDTEGQQEGDDSESEANEPEGDMTTSERHNVAADRLSAPTDRQRRVQREGQTNSNSDEDEKESPGARLGLGDFIFYSILLGRAADDSGGDWNVILACYMAILIGLCLTCLLLSFFKRALPALPISITFGLIFYFATNFLISPFISALAQHQVFI